jgi:DNA topoisomerase-2
MCYNPLQIIQYIKNKLSGTDEQIDFLPYYEGFKGTIQIVSESSVSNSSNGPRKFLIKGTYEKIGVDKIKIIELPVGFWTEDFKELLENLIEPGNEKDGKKKTQIIKDYDDMSKDTNVEFTVTFAKGKLDELEKNTVDYGCNGVEKLLKLFTTNTNSNMHLFDAADKLKKYESVQEIIDDYYETRMSIYQKRKNFMINSLEKELVLLTNKVKYIKENLDGTIDLRKKKKDEVVQMLENKGYDKINNKLEVDNNENVDIFENSSNKHYSDFNYLIKMPMDSVTEENVERLEKEQINKNIELDDIKNTTICQMWSNELIVLENQYLEYKEFRERLMNGLCEKKSKKLNKKK